MNRRVALVAAGLGLALVAGVVHLFVLGPSVGDCGLGTGGVYSLDRSGDPVAGPAEARDRVEAALDDPESEWAFLVEADAAEYERTDLDPEFASTIESRIDGDGRIYYFTPDGDPRYGTGTVGVRESGAVFVVQVGAC